MIVIFYDFCRFGGNFYYMRAFLFLILFISFSCNKKSDDNEIKIISRTKKLTYKDSLEIYTHIRNKNKVVKTQIFLDSIKKNDPEKYETIKKLIMNSNKELFEAQIYEGLDKEN